MGVAISHDDEQLCGGHVPFDFRDMQVAAGSGLGTRFKNALMKLEALMYVVYGAIPDYTGNKQWWTSPDVRCLWPEQLTYDIHTDIGFNVEEYEYHETSSKGEYAIAYPRFASTVISSTGYFDWGRTGHLQQQYHRTNHLAAWFPPGSVALSGVDQYGDPQPDTNLTISWTVPEGKRGKIASAKVVIAGTEHTMSSGDGITYSYVVTGASLVHNDRTHTFYLKIVTNEATPQTICDPYGASSSAAPTAFMPADTWDDDHHPGEDQNAQAKGNSYWFVPFKHQAPYEHGLPELLWQHYSGDKAAGLHRCTGTWQFEPWVNIKPGLINVARFCLDSLGEFFEQSPLLRGNSPGCCFKHPIRFRWSGGNRPWLYKPGGKSAGQITNLPGEANTGSMTARRSWRGSPAPNLGLGYCPGNPMYGDDESWLPWPSTAPWVWRGQRSPISGNYTDEWADGYTDAKQYRGLREGDQIDRVHIEEIIAAVNAILANGVWFIVKLKSCKRTPVGCGPFAAGQYMSQLHYQNPDYQPPSNGYTHPYDSLGICPCQDRFNGPYNPPANNDDCNAAAGFNVAAGYCPMYVRWQAWWGQEYHKNQNPQNTSHDGYHVECATSCKSEFSLPPYSQNDDYLEFNGLVGGCSVGIDSFAYDPDNVNCIAQGCSEGWTFNWYDGSGEMTDHFKTSRRCGATNGWSYYLCGPTKYYGGPGYDRWPNNNQRWDHIDTNHGNNFHKVRHEAYDDGTEMGKYQYVASMGNSAKRGYKCKGGDPQEITNWNTVVEVEDYGPAYVWGQYETSGGSCPMQDVNQNFPDIPGLGKYNAPDPNGNRTFMCRVASSYGETCYEWDPVNETCLKVMDAGTTDTQKCCLKFDRSYYPNCAPDSQFLQPLYMEVDLNLDGAGVPVLHDYDLSIHQVNPTNSSIHPDTPYDTDLQSYQTGGRPYDCTYGVLIAAGGVQCPKGTDCGCV